MYKATQPAITNNSFILQSTIISQFIVKLHRLYWAYDVTSSRIVLVISYEK